MVTRVFTLKPLQLYRKILVTFYVKLESLRGFSNVVMVYFPIDYKHLKHIWSRVRIIRYS